MKPEQGASLTIFEGRKLKLKYLGHGSHQHAVTLLCEPGARQIRLKRMCDANQLSLRYPLDLDDATLRDRHRSCLKGVLAESWRPVQQQQIRGDGVQHRANGLLHSRRWHRAVRAIQ